ncbi:MAG: hypothetical protein E6Q50_02825 [Lysobacter sp.]|nr:MAG: hypothetical protein E6Q50_02825 [Lysobacter sp.]
MNATRDATMPTMASAWRLCAMAVALTACVLVPFALWGDDLERAAPLWLQSRDGLVGFAIVGVALLVVDVLLPIPSSVVAVALCWALGPVAGGAAVAFGGFLSFATGYGLGRVLPEPMLRRWIGADLWDRVRDRARAQAEWWIVLARPLPVLAEVSAVLAGVWRLPPWRALAHAALASLALGALYGGSAWLGTRAPGAAATFAVLLALPAASWWLHRIALRRVSSSASSDVSLSADQEVP